MHEVTGGTNGRAHCSRIPNTSHAAGRNRGLPDFSSYIRHMLRVLIFFVTCVACTANAQSALRDEITTRIARDSGAVVGVAFHDLGNADTVHVLADSSFHAASTMKVPVMIELYRQSEQGALPLDRGVLLVNRFASIADGSFYSLDRGRDSDSSLYDRVGTRIPARELMQLMIRRSSNLATNVLIATVGADPVNSTARRLGASRIRVLRGVEDIAAFDRGMNNTTTARDLAILLNAIASPGVVSASSRAEMIEVLLGQEFNDEIPAGLPPGTKVAHKTGQITRVLHDAAIVYPEGRAPYILVVLTRNIADEKVAQRLIADIARLVHASAMRSVAR